MSKICHIKVESSYDTQSPNIACDGFYLQCISIRREVLATSSSRIIGASGGSAGALPISHAAMCVAACNVSLLNILHYVTLPNAVRACIVLGSWVRSEPTIAVGSVGLQDAPSPHLLVMGVGNSVDPGPTLLRQEAKRGTRRWR